MKQGTIWILVGAGAFALYLLNSGLSFLTGDDSQSLLQLLHPNLVDTATDCYNQALAQLPHGTVLVIDSTFRTFDQQAALYDQGRTTAGDIVTNAPAGYSYHNYGLALDFHLIVNGVDSWDNTNPAWATVVSIFTSAGFRWGGTFSKPDYDHFNYSFGFKVADLLALYNNGDFINGTVYVNLNG